VGTVIDRDRLAKMQSLLSQAWGSSWTLSKTKTGEPVVAVDFSDGRTQTLRVTREDLPASARDIEFIANSRHDLERLIARIEGTADLTEAELAAIDARGRGASPAPWRLFLEPDDGIGGGNVIWVSDRDDEPDLYLWRETQPASDADFELVATARNEIGELVDAARHRHDA
jgi:hypothetical protein